MYDKLQQGDAIELQQQQQQQQNQPNIQLPVLL